MEELGVSSRVGCASDGVSKSTLYRYSRSSRAGDGIPSSERDVPS